MCEHTMEVPLLDVRYEAVDKNSGQCSDTLYVTFGASCRQDTHVGTKRAFTCPTSLMWSHDGKMRY